MKEIRSQKISSSKAMTQLGKDLAILLGKPGLVLALQGDLGSGKTTFLKGFISQLTQEPVEMIQSPTFTYLQVYTAQACDIYHFDLYRITNSEQFALTGFLDYLEAGGICCIEWSERIENLLPPHTFFLDIAYDQNLTRICTLSQRKAL